MILIDLSQFIPTQKEPQRLAIKLSAQGEKSVLQGHPWIFSNSIVKVNKEGYSGDIAIIFSKNKNKVIGIGLFDPDSPIRIKMIHHGDALKIDIQFIRHKIQSAYSKRLELFQTKTNSYRLLFGENDSFPGLIADVYAEVLVVKLYSKIWLPVLEIILTELIDISDCHCAVIRLSRNLQASKSLKLKDGQVVYGILEDETVHFIEHGIHFSANVLKGHKTGYFLDHRHNRNRVGKLSKGKTVLDVFAYAGGFSVHALANGATEVTSLDISAQALELAKANVLLNSHEGTHNIIAGDAFKELKHLISEGKTFDIVVIDPPSFAKQQSEIQIAKKKYRQLAELGEKLTAKNGMLIMASCSSRILAKEFFEINHAVLNASHRSFRLEHQTEHDIDHPITFKEGAYLKCGFYRL
jgi:23S rRNA (cytosine1962-C5)-methyltransferase